MRVGIFFSFYYTFHYGRGLTAEGIVVGFVLDHTFDGRDRPDRNVVVYRVGITLNESRVNPE